MIEVLQECDGSVGKIFRVSDECNQEGLNV